MSEQEKFGFTVQRSRDWQTSKPKEPEAWRVYLPHSCDEWVVSGGYDGVPREQAIAELEAFIAEAIWALAALRAEQEIAEPSWGST